MWGQEAEERNEQRTKVPQPRQENNKQKADEEQPIETIFQCLRWYFSEMEATKYETKNYFYIFAINLGWNRTKSRDLGSCCLNQH